MKFEKTKFKVQSHQNKNIKKGSNIPTYCYNYNKGTKIKMSRDEEEKKESNGIEVFLRIRPSTNPSGYINQDDIDETQIVFQLPKKHQQLDHSINSGEGDDIVNNTRTKYGFKFNGILDEEATQDDVYRSIGAPAVQNVLEGFNSTVFAYGQTGSGRIQFGFE